MTKSEQNKKKNLEDCTDEITTFYQNKLYVI